MFTVFWTEGRSQGWAEGLAATAITNLSENKEEKNIFCLFSRFKVDELSLLLFTVNNYLLFLMHKLQ